MHHPSVGDVKEQDLTLTPTCPSNEPSPSVLSLEMRDSYDASPRYEVLFFDAGCSDTRFAMRLIVG